MEDIYNYVYIWNKPRFQGIFLQLYCIYHFSTYFIIYHIKGFVLIIIIIILIYIYIYIYTQLKLHGITFTSEAVSWNIT